MRLRLPLLMLAATLACTPQPAPPDTQQLAGLTAVGRSVSVHVMGAHWHDAASSQLSLDLAFKHGMKPAYNGQTSLVRGIIIERNGITLHTDLGAFPARDAGGEDAFGEQLYVPPPPRGGVRGDLVFDLPEGASPPRWARLVLETREGWVELPLFGGQGLIGDASPSLSVLPVDLAGRPLEGDVTVETRGTPLQGQRVAPDGPWRGPRPSTSVDIILEVPGRPPVATSFPPGALSSTLEVVVPRGPHHIVDSTAATLLTDPPETPKTPSTLLALLPTFHDAADAAAWVATHIRALPQHGLQRSPQATLEARAGSPLDRAALLAAILGDLGYSHQFVCGSLTVEEAREVYGAPHVEETSRLKALGDQATVIADGLQAGLTASLAEASAPNDRWSTTRITPEWCWVESTRDDQPTADSWTIHDLRPPSMHGTPLPFAWRSMTNIGALRWPIVMTLRAVLRDDNGDPYAVDVLTHDTDLLTLSQNAYAIDVWPAAERPDHLHVRLAKFDAVLANGSEGTPVPPSRLERLVLEVDVRDPLDVATDAHTATLWQRPRSGAGLRRVRSVFSASSLNHQPQTIMTRLEQALLRDHPIPGAMLDLAQHTVFGYLRDRASHGLIPAEPDFFLTNHVVDGSGAHQQFTVINAPAPASWDGAADFAARARLGAADAAARQVMASLEGRDLVIQPPGDQWTADPNLLGKRTQLDQRAYGDVRQSLEAGHAVQVTDNGTIWTWDLQTAAAAPLATLDVRPAFVGTERPPSTDDPFIATDKVWDHATLCAQLVFWHQLLHDAPLTDLPADCEPG